MLIRILLCGKDPPSPQEIQIKWGPGTDMQYTPPWECVHNEKCGPRAQEQGLNAELGKLGELSAGGEK